MPIKFIGPFQTGLKRDVEPLFLPEDAFTDLENAYIFRGVVRSKECSSFLGRLHTTPALPEALAAVATGAATYTDTLANPPISPGTVTIVISTAPAMTFTDNGNGTLTSAIVDVNFGTIDYETGTFILSFNPVIPLGGPFAVNATAYRTLPRLPVMGLSVYDLVAINREDLIAFDTANSYRFGSSDIFDELTTGSWGVNPQFTNSDSSFVWTANYYTDATNNKLMWAVNDIDNDANLSNGVQYFNGTTWVTQVAQLNATDFLRGCRLILPYRNRLVVLNTLEGAAAPAVSVRRAQRARWSQNGTPLVSVDAAAWRSDQIGRGGFIDAPTSEAIISAAFVKDTLIVFFERSTWELRYTANEILPFIWQKINNELGSESAFSVISFDDGVLAVGEKRIVSANSAGVVPIDKNIPDEVYRFHNDNNGPARVHGERDFFRQLAIWTYPNADQNSTYPNRVLAFNYELGSFSMFRDSLTTLGQYQRTADYTWASPPAPTWAETDLMWSSPINQSFFPSIVGGNQRGFVLILFQNTANEHSLDLTGPASITNAVPAVFTITSHNLEPQQFIRIGNTRAFPQATAAESLGTAASGSIRFNCALANRGYITGTLVITMGAITFTDVGDNSLNSATAGASGTINYDNGFISLTFAALGIDTAVTAAYDSNILNTRPFEIRTITANTFTLNRYQADIVAEAAGTTVANSTSFSFVSARSPLVSGTLKIIMGTNTFRDDGNGGLDGGSGTSIVNYTTGEVTLNYPLLAGATAVTASYSYLIEGLGDLDFSAEGAPYDGTGEISIIDNILIKSKRFSPFLNENIDFRLKYIDLLLTQGRGSFEIDTFVNQASTEISGTHTVSTAAENTISENADKVTKRVFINAISNFIQFEMNRSRLQMSNPIDYDTQLRLNAITLDVAPSGRMS